MLARVLLLLASWQWLIHTGYTLQVTSSSLCNSTCDGGSGTYTSDLVCSDGDYENTAQGQSMRSCMTCLQNSTAYETARDNDIYWFLCTQHIFHLRSKHG